jgi:AmmeMemoRadiSam system protein A
MFGELLISTARQAILDRFHKDETLDIQKILAEDERFSQEAATFVTLTLDGQLRGCIGSIIPHRTLLSDLISNAKSAAFHDPRFAPLSQQEFERITIEVSLLTIPQRFEYETIADLKAYIEPRHGVILKQGSAQATFLPQVWEELSDFDLFFSHLCQKAGLASGCLQQHPEIYLYEVEKFKE